MGMPKLVLHNYWRSSASHRVRIGLGLKGLPWDAAVVNLRAGEGEQRTPEYRALNPLAQVPALEILEEDGTRKVLTQSLPILEYLDERWPAPLLLPADSYLRARTRALAEVVNSGIQPFQNLSATRRIAATGGDENAWTVAFVRDGFAALETMTAATAGRFSVGDLPTLADCCLVPQMCSARRFGVALDAFPTLVRIDEACAALPAFASAHPDRQPDAPG